VHNGRTIGDLLAEHDFFSGLATDDLGLIAGCGRNVTFPPGAHLFREGEPADRFFLLRHGRVALEINIPGRGSFVLDTVGPGELTGASWLFPPYRWQFDGRAVDGIRAVELDGSCLRDKCEADPRLGYELMKRFATVLAGRMQSARMRLVDLYGRAATH
jgi:CRP-like cAMP-binding protein